MNDKDKTKGKLVNELAVLHRQINNHKRKESKLKKIKEEMWVKENAMASSINAIAVADLDGNLTYVNQSFLKMWGYDSEKEVLEKPIVKFWKMKGKYVEIMDTLFDKGDWIGELVAERKNESTFNVQLSASMIKNKSNKPLCMMASLVDIAEHKRAEEEIIQTKKHLQNIINSTSEAIISFDKDNRVSIWNKTAEFVTRYKQREVIGKPITKLGVFDNSNEIIDHIKSVREGHKAGRDELILKTKDGSKRILRVSSSVVEGVKEGGTVLFVGKDITYERESHRKLLMGNSYLISDKDNTPALDLFMDLTRSGYKGLFITRANPEIIKSMISFVGVQILLMNRDKLGGFGNISDLDGLTAKIKEFSMKHTNSVILLDRVDYLITRFSFERFAESLYQINSIVSENNSLLLLHLSPSVVDNRQMSIIEAELQPLPSQKIEDIQIEDELFAILKYIQEQNQNNAVVSFKKISKEFSLVKSTTAKRLGMLEDKGLVFIKKQGRLKTVHISKKGKILIHKRKIV